MRVTEDALVLLRLGREDGGRLDPARFASRPVNSASSKAFAECLTAGLCDGDGYLTPIGEEALELWAG